LKATIKKKLNPDPTDMEQLLKDAPPLILPAIFTPHFDFIDISPIEIARQLCLIDFDLYKK
jgi:hypothetical protein